jgi:hypothetical protein
MLYLLTWFIYLFNDVFKCHDEKFFENWVLRTLTFPLFSILSVEILSMFEQLTITNLRIINFFVLSIFFFKFISSPILKFKKIQFSRINIYFIFILFVLLASALIYAPINEDANFYHLPRVIHWLDHGDLNPYSTTITNQIYQPYLSEIQLLWIYSTFGGLNLLNAIQVLYFTNICFLLILYLKIYLKIKPNIALFISLTVLILINSLFLQVSQPKNDVTLTFFVVVFVILIIVGFEHKFNNNLLYGLILTPVCIILTKGLGYVYLLAGIISILFMLIFSRNSLKNFIYNIKFNKILVGFFVFAILAYSPSVYRNIQVSGSISGQTEAEAKTLRVEELSSINTLSQLTKFIFSNLSGPFVDENHLLSLSGKIHTFFNSDQDVGNFMNMPFSISSSKSLKGIYAPLSSGNLLLFLTLLASIIVFIKGYKINTSIPVSFYFLFFFVLISFLLIFSLFKWQPWMNRFYNPLFVILVLYALILFYRSGNKFTLNLIGTLAFVNFCLGMFLGHSGQPILPISSINRDIDKSLILKDNYRATMGVKYDYWGIRKIDHILNQGNKNILLMVNGADPVFGIMRNNRIQKNHFTYFTEHYGKITFEFERIRHRKDFDYKKADILVFNKDYSEFIPNEFIVVTDDDSYYGVAIKAASASPF